MLICVILFVNILNSYCAELRFILCMLPRFRIRTKNCFLSNRCSRGDGRITAVYSFQIQDLFDLLSIESFCTIHIMFCITYSRTIRNITTRTAIRTFVRGANQTYFTSAGRTKKWYRNCILHSNFTLTDTRSQLLFRNSQQ